MRSKFEEVDVSETFWPRRKEMIVLLEDERNIGRILTQFSI